MVDQEQLCAGSETTGDGVDDLILRSNRKRYLSDHYLRSPEMGYEFKDIAGGVVLMAGRNELITWRELQRTENGVDAGGDVTDKRQAVRSCANESPERTAGLVEMRFQVAGEKPHRIPFEIVAKFLLSFLDRNRTGTERSVIEEMNVRTEGPVLGERSHGRVLNRKSGECGGLECWNVEMLNVGVYNGISG